jgi:hypothetical protein
LKSRTNAAFRELLADLPANVREQAFSAYLLFRDNPSHASLHYKKVHPNRPIMSVRVGGDYRAVGIQREPGAILWFWIGPHEQYETLLANLKYRK